MSPAIDFTLGDSETPLWRRLNVVFREHDLPPCHDNASALRQAEENYQHHDTKFWLDCQIATGEMSFDEARRFRLREIGRTWDLDTLAKDGWACRIDHRADGLVCFVGYASVPRSVMARLYNLTDYVVTGTSGGSVWLRPVFCPAPSGRS